MSDVEHTWAASGYAVIQHGTSWSIWLLQLKCIYYVPAWPEMFDLNMSDHCDVTAQDHKFWRHTYWKWTIFYLEKVHNLQHDFVLFQVLLYNRLKQWKHASDLQLGWTECFVIKCSGSSRSYFQNLRAMFEYL